MKALSSGFQLWQLYGMDIRIVVPTTCNSYLEQLASKRAQPSIQSGSLEAPTAALAHSLGPLCPRLAQSQATVRDPDGTDEPGGRRKGEHAGDRTGEATLFELSSGAADHQAMLCSE